MSIENTNVYFPPAPPLPHVIVPFPMFITVHLGAPDEDAPNVTVPFIDYIKNVASSELYPTWPEEALRANIHAITSIAMNRIFTEWYRSRGYDFDITNDTQYDQAFVYGRGIFDNISQITNEIFDEYIVRTGHIEPLFATFCDGRITQCDGMYQWGSVDLANQGYDALDILKYYYGDDIEIIKEPLAGGITGTYPGSPLELGDAGIDVLRMQHSLSNISERYPLIPKVDITGFFDKKTEDAVKVFQQVFNLPVTGVVDKDTWYRIRFIWVAVTSLGELITKGLTLDEIQLLYTNLVLEGGTFPLVPYIQYYLNVISQKYNTIIPPNITQLYGPETTKAVIEFQNIVGLPPTGIVDQNTLNALYREAYQILTTTPVENIRLPPSLPFLGLDLKEGMGLQYPRILFLQIMLSYISMFIPEIPPVEINGIFGLDTTASVIAFQKLYGLPQTGVVDEATWHAIILVYQELLNKISNNEQTQNIQE